MAESPDTSLYNRRCLWWPAHAAPEMTWLRDFVHQTQSDLPQSDWPKAHRVLQILGTFGVARLPVKATPFADRYREENLRALTDGLRGLMDPNGGTPVFDVEVRNTIGGDDGSVSADIPLLFNRLFDGGEFWAPVEDVPLEIGQTKAGTTLQHLALGRCLARWPYGHDHLFIVMLAPEAHHA